MIPCVIPRVVGLSHAAVGRTAKSIIVKKTISHIAVDIFLSNGHTLGLMHPIISDGNQTIFYGSDLFPTATHIPVQWVMSYDIQPMITIQEKNKLLKKMHEENWILFFEHDPNFQACTINWAGNKYNKKDSVTISE